MSKRVKEWARKARVELLHALGDECVRCGEKEYSLLQFDHKKPETKTYSSRGLSTDQRMCRYRKEFKKGWLQILCLFCNSRKNRNVNQGETDFELNQSERDAMDMPDHILIVESDPDYPY